MALIEGRYADDSVALDILESRILARSSVIIRRAVEGTAEAEEALRTAQAAFLVGRTGGHGLLASIGRELGIQLPCLPDTDKVHPESFAIRTADLDGKRKVLLLGADQRGTIYGVGEALRSITYLPAAIRIPQIDVREKPAFRLRGPATGSGPNPALVELGQMRPQTEEERLWAFQDHAFLGANVAHDFDREWAKDLGLMTYLSSCVNDLPGGFPEEWAATPHNSLHIKVNSYFRKRYVCPSIPAARKAILEGFEKRFRDSPEVDIFATKSGDVAGCACGKCMPYGRTFMALLREVADILHRYHPATKVMAANQNLTDEGDQAMLDYLNEADSSWFCSLRYGPGSNEMSTYNRAPLNPRWFKYEGFGKHSNYLKYLHHELPRNVGILLFSDVTHWIRSQYGVEKPDVAMAVIYNRRAWNARPRHLHRIATGTFHYATGDLFYTEGMHDDFNKWLWYRMLWNPHLSADEITREYCRYWFGPEAEDPMVDAIFLMEQNLERPVLGNPGIARAVELLRSGRQKASENLMRRDYRWRIIMQKALLDRYIQLWLERGEQLKAGARPFLEKAAESDDPAGHLGEALEILKKAQETDEMRAIRDEVGILGEESNEVIGYREPAYFNMKGFDITEIGWWIREIERALATSRPGPMRGTAKMVLHYEDPGEGGFFERVGWPWERIHLLEHENIIEYFPFAGPARITDYCMGYSWGGKDTHMVLRYVDLDPRAEYVVRISSGFHQEELKDLIRGKIRQSLWVNGEPMGIIPLPFGEVRVFEFAVPKSATQEGKAEIVLRSEPGAFPVVGLNAIWLMKRDKMPWSAEEALG